MESSAGACGIDPWSGGFIATRNCNGTVMIEAKPLQSDTPRYRRLHEAALFAWNTRDMHGWPLIRHDWPLGFHNDPES
jgi:hypothetical protein